VRAFLLVALAVALGIVLALPIAWHAAAPQLSVTFGG
jgi:hypothetical protein